MKSRPYVLFVCFLLTAAPLWVPRQAWATLGGTVDSVESDRRVLAAVRHATTARDAYAVHEMRSDAASVREYVSPAGVVFGIAWNGVAHPDLTPLLGAYADAYRQALGHVKRVPGRRQLQVRSDGVVVEKWGHMRNLQGRAYAPALIPSGVSVDEIK